MNKKLSVLFLLPLLGIAACSGSSKASINKQGDVLKGDVLKANIGKADQYRFNSSSIELGFESKKIEGIANFSSATQLSGASGKINVLHVSTSDGKTGLINLATQEWLVPLNEHIVNTFACNRQFSQFMYYATQETLEDPFVYHFIRLDNGEEFYSSDELPTRTILGVGASAETRVFVYGGEAYFLERFSFATQSADYLYCATNLETGEFLYAVNRYPFVEADEVGGYQQQLLNETVAYSCISLKEYGHPGYKLYRNGDHYYVINNKGKRISSFEEPLADATFLMMGDYFIMQKSQSLLPEETEKYSFIDENGGKHSLQTKAVNYLTGKVSDLSVKYVIDLPDEQIVNKKEVVKYQRATLSLIKDDKTLDKTERSFLIDEKGVLHDDLTNVGRITTDFQTFGKYYFDSESGKVYDKNFKVQYLLSDNSYIHNNYEYEKDAALIFANGLRGLINSENKVLIKPVYSSLYLETYDGTTIEARDADGKDYILNVKDGSVVNDFSEYDDYDAYDVPGYYVVRKDTVSQLYRASTGEFFLTPTPTEGYTVNCTYTTQTTSETGATAVNGAAYVNYSAGAIEFLNANFSAKFANAKK